MTDEPADHTIHDELDVEELLRGLTADDLTATEPPPPSVWAGIQARIAADEEPVAGGAAVTSLDERRARRFGVPGRLAAAAAAVVVIVAGAVVLATRGDDDELVASARLRWDPADPAFDPLGADATATAELVRRDGGYALVLTDADLPAEAETEADLELWLISTDPAGTITDVQPVSLVDPASPRTYLVPPGLDPDTYTVVDISIEPRDGDAAHSGNSILRGTLGT